MNTHNICFCGETSKIFTWYPLLSRPMFQFPLSEYLGTVEYIDKQRKPWSNFLTGCIDSFLMLWLKYTNLHETCSGQISIIQGPVVQSIVSLTSSLVVKMLTVLVSTIPKSQVFLLKNVSSFCKCKSYSHFFSKNLSVYAVFNNQSFNDTLTNSIVSFEQLGPVRR